jgi:uncharacterized protein
LLSKIARLAWGPLFVLGSMLALGSLLVAGLFWSWPDRRLRAVWRLLLQTAVLYAGLLVVSYAGRYVTRLLAPGARPSRETLEITSVLYMLVAVVASVAIAGWLLDRRPLAAFGFHFSKGWWLDFGFGMVLAAATMGGIFLVELAAGWITVTDVFWSTPGQPFWLGMVVWLGVFLAVGIYEEMLSRGYHLRNLAEGLSFRPIGPQAGLIVAWLASSVVFGLAHANNPGATVVSTLCLCLAGIQLGLGFVLTGELALPIGLHIAWNFFEGPVFGFPVSGIAPGPSLLRLAPGGPDLWTGGAFGPEAGVLGILAELVGMVAIFLWVRWRRGRAVLCTDLAVYRRQTQAGIPPGMGR